MPKQRSTRVRPIARQASGKHVAKLASNTQKIKTKEPDQKTSAKKVRLHQSGLETKPSVRKIPWWVLPEEERALLPGGGGSPGGPGLFPPPPGPSPGPGPGPGLFPPGPGPFPPGPGPGPFPPGPGPFPPGPLPPGPGPGPFPPGPGPFPPGPFPLPIPLPIPGPGPFPPPPFPGPAFINVRVIGGFAFPGATSSTFVPFYPGITLRQALISSGLVSFGPLGRITSVAGIRIFGSVGVGIFYNGRLIPESLLNAPAQPNSTIALQLFYQ